MTFLPIVILGLDPSIQVDKLALLFNLDSPVKPENDDKNKSNHDNRDILSYFPILINIC